MIEIDGLTKRYGDKTAVDRLSFVVEPGVVTGFLGPNGAGKSTTMRMIAGLDRPDSGTVRVNGKHYPQAPAPMAELGILLDARSVHPGLSARANLLALRSTWWCGLTAVALIVGLGAAIAGSGTAYHVWAADSAARGVSVSLLGVLFAQLVVGVVGVLAFSGEYGTGIIRATLAVVPARLPVLWAKVIVLVGLVLPVTMLCAFVDFFAATALVSSRGGSVISLTDPGVLRTVVGSSLYLTVVVIIGLALGALLRKTAAGLSVFAAVFFVIPVVVGALPQNITGFAPYLPSNAGGALWGSPLGTAHALSPWTGFACLCGYAVVLTAVAAWRLRRRDA